MIYSSLLGALTMVGVLALVDERRRAGRPVSRRLWGLTGLWIAFVVVTVEVIRAFLAEDARQGAVVFGGALAFVAVLAAVGLWRFGFGRPPGPAQPISTGSPHQPEPTALPEQRT